MILKISMPLKHYLISAKTRMGIDELMEALNEKLREGFEAYQENYSL